MIFLLSSRPGTLLKYTRLSKMLISLASSDCYAKNDNKPTQAESIKPVAVSGQSHPVYKRDLINFPRIERLETNPPVRFGFIPKTWFDFFYKKTGVTGGYMLMFGGLVALFSKEILVVNFEMIRTFGYIFLVVAVQKLYGQTIHNAIVGKQEELEAKMDSFQYEEENSIKNNIKQLEKELWCSEGVATYLAEAKRENVYLQMETTYRERLQAQYMAVKNVLDYQVEKSNIERLAIQKGLVSWIINSVNQSITPEIKLNALTKSIEDLKDLASRTTI